MPPNFVFIITDQHRAEHLGCYGNRVLATPHIDALAARGWSADNLYVASGICMPNRASILTGRMPSCHGVRHNGIPLSLGANTFVESLRQGGYRTVMVGKSHLQNMTDQGPQWPPAGHPRPAGEAHLAAPGDYRQEQPSFWRAGGEMTLPFYGFSAVDLADGHGDDLHGHYWRWLEREHPLAASLAGERQAGRAPGYALAEAGQAWRTRLPEELHPTSWIGERTAAHIRDCAGRRQPFFLYCSFPDPHHPFTPPGRYWDMYRPQDMELPDTFHARTQPPPHLAWLRAQRDAGKAVKNTPGVFAATAREVREAIALAYGSIALIDAQVGRIVDTLRELGLERDTVIVFTTDHGDFMGDHQLLWKGPLHYRSVVRSPLIWADPEGPRATRGDALLSAVDIAPTVLERAGVAGYNGLQGHSMLPLMRGERRSVRDAVLIEEEGQRVALGFSGRVRMRSIITARHRMSVYEGAEWAEIYDRQADPDERANLWRGAADPLAGELSAAMARTMIGLSETSPLPTHVA